MRFFHARNKKSKEMPPGGVIVTDGVETPGRGVDDLIEREMIAVLPRLRRFAASLTRGTGEADDLVQATCERAIRNIGKWDPGTRLDSWMYRIAHNLHLNGVRDRGLRARRQDAAAQEGPQSVDGEAAAMARIEIADVDAALDVLPAEQRTALLLVAVEGRSYREIADITGATVATVNNRVARARDSLRSMLRSDRHDHRA